jgi:BASS family bile acid:Na+ symporter
MAKTIVSLFALWILIGCAVAFAFPWLFAGLGAAVVPLLGLVMLGMGVTLKAEDFRAVFLAPRAVAVGCAAQFLWMPLLGWLIATLLELPRDLAVGMVLVGACPGGTASNVLTYLAGGDVALAVTLTGLTTILATLLTPLLTYVYAHAWVEVPVLALLLKILQVVIVPVALGVLLRRWAGRRQDLLLEWMPVVSVAGVVFIVAVIVAGSRATIVEQGGILFLAVALHNLLGMAAGYATARAFRLPPAQVRAIAIEVAVQDSGLGVALAKTFFGSTAALPSAVFSVWQNLSGPVAAWLFRGRTRSALQSEARCART